MTITMTLLYIFSISSLPTHCPLPTPHILLRYLARFRKMSEFVDHENETVVQQPRI